MSVGFGLNIGKPAVRIGPLAVGRAAVALGGGGQQYEFAAGSLAGEVERLTASGDYTLSINGHDLPVEYIQYDSDLVLDSNTDFGSATPDATMVCVKVRGNLTVEEGVTVTTTDRKLGLMFFVTGDVTIDGTVDMTARGANHSPSGSDLAEFDLLVISGIGADGVVPEAGGGGGAAKATNGAGNPGTAGSNGGTGGGGGGARNSAGSGGSGTAGTSLTGGTGGGGVSGGDGSGTDNATARGGVGGVGWVNAGGLGAGGGAGNPGGAGGGTGGTPQPGGNGTGGVLIAIILGIIAIGATGIVRSNGVAGGAALTVGGGGSGGGSVNLYRRGTYTNNGTVQANGGAGGNTGVNGGAGGAGSVRAVQL